MAFKVTSAAFADGSTIPRQFTCDGNDAPPPSPSWIHRPARGVSRSSLDDPDAPNGTFTHWLAYDIATDTAELVANGGKTLRNDFGRKGYGGPCPPAADKPHRYTFIVYAVDVPSLSIKGDRREDLETALGGHVLATARLVGKYGRAPGHL